MSFSPSPEVEDITGEFNPSLKLRVISEFSRTLKLGILSVGSARPLLHAGIHENIVLDTLYLVWLPWPPPIPREYHLPLLEVVPASPGSDCPFPRTHHRYPGFAPHSLASSRSRSPGDSEKSQMRPFTRPPGSIPISTGRCVGAYRV